MKHNYTDVLEKIFDSQKIKRDKGLNQLSEVFLDSETDADTIHSSYTSRFLQVLQGPLSVEGWEKHLGALLGLNLILTKISADSSIISASECIAFQYLHDSESRVRMAAADLARSLAAVIGVQLFSSRKQEIYNNINHNMTRSFSPPTVTDTETSFEYSSLLKKFASDENGTATSTCPSEVFHDTAGWNYLETWTKCLQAIVDGCGNDFVPFVDTELLELVYTIIRHQNRFVRETGFGLIASIVLCLKLSPESDFSGSALEKFAPDLANNIALGLSDNWSQVRMAGSIAARNFLSIIPTEDLKNLYYPSILGPLYLNRYYVAEGVRVYNQVTWRQTCGENGKVLIERHIDSVVKFYISQTEADNHAVREAACSCIAELGDKVSLDAVRQHVPKLLDALLVCFRDESWPVRDAACIACGNFVSKFADESRSRIDELMPLFFENLSDAIPSVRDGAATALGHLISSYGDVVLDQVIPFINKGLVGVKDQKACSERFPAVEKIPATFGVVTRIHGNIEDEKHTDKQMYSCGSLAPKMHKGSHSGCSNHSFRKSSELWEITDGCVLLVAVMAKQHSLVKSITPLLKTVAEAGSYHHYDSHVYLLETICSKIPTIAEGLGKREFKPHLEQFFDLIFYSLKNDTALTRVAAEDCLKRLAGFLGPGILKGRVEMYNPAYASSLETLLSTMPPATLHFVSTARPPPSRSPPFL